MPIESLVHTLQHGTAHHQCEHPEGVCPMSPDGTCECAQDEASAFNEPVLTSCDGDQSNPIGTTTLSKWLPVVQIAVRPPQHRPPPQFPRHARLRSQRVGDTVFRPPRRWVESTSA